ncbi:MAG: hypothetical protein ACLQM6_08665 [Acidobacteriaceae bacterium]
MFEIAGGIIIAVIGLVVLVVVLYAVALHWKDFVSYLWEEWKDELFALIFFAVVIFLLWIRHITHHKP